jgi:hypothetical protein
MQPQSPVSAFCPAYKSISGQQIQQQIEHFTSQQRSADATLTDDRIRGAFRSTAARKNLAVRVENKWSQGMISTRSTRKDSLPYGMAAMSFKKMSVVDVAGHRTEYIKSYFYFLTILGTVDNVASDQLVAVH